MTRHGAGTMRRAGAALAVLGAVTMLGVTAVPAGAATSPSPEPTATPVATTSPEPTASASPEPSIVPSAEPTVAPTVEPAEEPTPAADDVSDGGAPVVGVMAETSVLTSPFTDVSAVHGSPTYSVFAGAIAWMAATGISTGWTSTDGSLEYRPDAPVTREQMAAFLHRFAGSPVSAEPKASPFTDVSRTATFFHEITWMWRQGFATGWTTSSGSEYRPVTSITREQMAAFLYRAAGSPAVASASTTGFTDVPASSTFATEITWLAQTGISTGWSTTSGAEFRPTEPISREAMAAFLYRMNALGLAPETDPSVTLRHTTLYVYGATTLNLRTGPSTAYPVGRQLTNNTAVTATGVTDGAWIEVSVGGALLWARSDYLIGKNGAAITRIKSLYSNGKLPDTELCGLTWDSVEFLECTAAYDLELLNAEFFAEFGLNIPLNDSYRDYDTQVLYKQIYGTLAATPGTSNHGWGAAIDISTARLPGGTDGDAYAWIVQHLGVYNWVLPTWARPDGTKPEAWHFEYTG